LVPLIPGIFMPPCDGYRHEGTEVYLKSSLGERADVQALVNPSHYFELASDGYLARRALKRGDFNFITQYHSIENDYMKLLSRIIS